MIGIDIVRVVAFLRHPIAVWRLRGAVTAVSKIDETAGRRALLMRSNTRFTVAFLHQTFAVGGLDDFIAAIGELG